MSVTSKGQVTIPAPIRRLLGLIRNVKVAFRVESNIVTVEPARSALQSLYGAVEPLSRPEDFEQMTEIAQEAQALRATAG